MENFGEYFLGALGCINMVLAMRKFEIQWTFCDYVAPALEEAGETMLGKRGSFLVLVATMGCPSDTNCTGVIMCCLCLFSCILLLCGYFGCRRRE